VTGTRRTVFCSHGDGEVTDRQMASASGILVPGAAGPRRAAWGARSSTPPPIVAQNHVGDRKKNRAGTGRGGGTSLRPRPILRPTRRSSIFIDWPLTARGKIVPAGILGSDDDRSPNLTVDGSGGCAWGILVSVPGIAPGPGAGPPGSASAPTDQHLYRFGWAGENGSLWVTAAFFSIMSQ